MVFNGLVFAIVKVHDIWRAALQHRRDVASVEMEVYNKLERGHNDGF